MGMTGNKRQEIGIELLTPYIASIGYEIVALEVLNHPGRILRVFIDHSGEKKSDKGIGVDDCAKVSRAIDEPLDEVADLKTWVDGVFKGSPYDLEVSSPGVTRPLRMEKDFIRFSGERIRVHTFRPLEGEESGNESYLEQNPRRKNFLGVLKGFEDGMVQIRTLNDDGLASKGKKKKAAEAKQGEEVITIPLTLITKAHLEPEFSLVSDETQKVG